MAATLATFRVQFPEFAATADGVVDRALVEALLIHSVRELATLFLTAHLLECDAKRAAGTPLVGEVASEQAGDIKSDLPHAGGRRHDGRLAGRRLHPHRIRQTLSWRLSSGRRVTPSGRGSWADGCPWRTPAQGRSP